MRRPLSNLSFLCALSLVSVGCEDTLSAAPFVSDAAFLEALPRAEDQALAVARLDDDWSGPSPILSAEDGWVDLLGISMEVASSLNDITRSCLSSVDSVSGTSPSYRSATARSWGPVDVGDDRSLFLDMTRLQGDYSWDFKEQATDGPLLSICAGTHEPASGDLSGGRGVFDVWLDNWSDLGGAVGTLGTEYDLTNGQELRIDIEGLGEVGGRAEDGAYYFWKSPEGGGDFQYRTELLLGGDLEAVFEVRTRWNADGSGRADARVTDEDRSWVVRFSECFEGRDKVWKWTNFRGGFEQGDASDCALATPAVVDQI